MLCLSRKPGESVILTTPDGGRIEVRVAKVQGGRVRLLLGANRRVNIVRAEKLELRGAGNGVGDVDQDAIEPPAFRSSTPGAA